MPTVQSPTQDLTGGPPVPDAVLDVVRTHASDVDRAARFPAEAIAALRELGLLAAPIPTDLGGSGASLTRLAAITRALGAECASTAMIYAMHQTQLLSLTRHGLSSPAIAAFVERVATEGLLLASATTEIGIGGDVRSSSCAVTYEGSQFTLSKNAPVISYGAYADAILVTARRSPESNQGDQVLVLCPSDRLELEQTGAWDTLGFRGTCSPGFLLKAQGSADWVLPVPYSTISARSMLPTAHVLWAAAWSGIADAAVAKARKAVRQQARRNPGTTPPAALRLAELSVIHDRLVDTVRSAAADFDDNADNPARLDSIGFAIHANNVKVTASELVVEIVGRAMVICGIAGYRDDSDLSIGRHLRDAHGSQIMVSNERILAHNAQLGLIYKGDR
ncbi:acyl-CoA dehydrogenase family protein [Millisia brevis]|uniref:acyl-CoA dehydrogenase family protein n=1 Tax=Millisia brevis TaxID=264148 RepID=UPI000832466D|nr:acyl-CoA dehydrogenase family protein [Millisia brevis]